MRFPFDTNCPVATRSKKMDARAETRAGGPQNRQREKMSCWRRAGRTAWSRRVSGQSDQSLGEDVRWGDDRG